MQFNESIKYINEHATDYLKPDASKKGYICPICGSGSGCNFGYWWHSGMKRPGQTLHVLAHETCSTLDMQLVCISGERVSVSPTIVNI